MTTWHCLTCPTTGEGDPATADRAAERHTRTEQHPTVTRRAGWRVRDIEPRRSD